MQTALETSKQNSTDHKTEITKS